MKKQKDHYDKMVRLMNKSISRTKRKLFKSKNLYYDDVPALEMELLNKKQKLKNFKDQFKNLKP